ncbi:MAG: MerR family transcriptional regulator [Rubrobacter sp.]|nr:MerR family transcriptional regulator [Rubrobacter sp.]
MIALGEGIYTVPEVARILKPATTEYKIRYWLDEGLLGEPVRRGRRGRPHLLSFRQLLQARTIQHLRDALGFPLQKVRPVIEEIADLVFTRLFDESHEIQFIRTPTGEIGVFDGTRTYELKTGQYMMTEAIIPELNEILEETRKDWKRGEVRVEGYPRLVSNARIVAGSPTIKGTRIETSFVAYLAGSLGVEKVLELYPHLDREAVLQARSFEGEMPLAV